MFLLNLNKYIILFLAVVFLFYKSENLIAAKNSYSKSYYGSILSGQIANYNNDTNLSADFFNYANNINPKNIQIYNLALMSLIMSGKIEKAIEKVKYYDKNFGSQYTNTVIANFIIFINKIKNNQIDQALSHIIEKKEFLITEKMKPIIKAWLASNLTDATNYINEYEYKSEGLTLSNIYFHNLALIQNYHNKKSLAQATFEKHLNSFNLEKLRTLFLYESFLSDEENKSNNKFLALFLKEYSDHGFSLYLREKEGYPTLLHLHRRGFQKQFIILRKHFIPKVCLRPHWHYHKLHYSWTQKIM